MRKKASKSIKLWIEILLIASVLQITGIQSICERKSSETVKTFRIDLDKPPIERYAETAAYFKDNIIKVFNQENQKSNRYFQFYFPIRDRINPFALPLLEFLASNINQYFPYPFNEEIRGIAAALDSEIGDVVIANIIYDFTAYCTSIVAQRSDGQILHGRNLDYDFAPNLQNITFIADFYRNGSLLFKSAQLGGFIGIVTGYKYKQFTFSINERDQGDALLNILTAILDQRSMPLSFLTRAVMENATSYDEAVNILATSDLIAPAYFIVGGTKPYEGTILTRNQSSLIDRWKLDGDSKGIEKWYLLETNYDHWLPPPPDDDRRTPAMKAMNATTQEKLNDETLFAVLRMKPVCNKDTVYSVVMSAIDDESDGFEIII